ncbi:MAG: hypothetical protein N3A38_02275 [Planctomycetota bacterium]|nr:hypothetical protein [Planctomycetota bacterium]
MPKPRIPGALTPDRIGEILAAPFKRVYAVVGPDVFLRERVLAKLRDAFLKGEDTSIAFVSFRGPASPSESAALTPAMVLDEAETPPLFSRRKMVAVRRCDLFVRENAAAIARRIPRIPETCVLVLEGGAIGRRGGGARGGAGKSGGEESDENREAGGRRGASDLLDAVSKHGAIIECATPYATLYGSPAVSARSEMGRLVAEMGRERGLKLGDDAVVALIELAGERLAVIENEIEKLRVRFAAPGPELPPSARLESAGRSAAGTAAGRVSGTGAAAASGGAPGAAPIRISGRDVHETCADARQLHVFALADLIAARDRVRSLDALARLFEFGAADPYSGGKAVRDDKTIAILFLSAMFRTLGKIEAGRARLDAGGSFAEAGRAMGAWAGREEAAGRNAALWEKEDISAACETLLRADLDLKLSRASAQEILERLIFEICPSRQAPARR